MTLKDLIYTKMIQNEEVKYKLLDIATSSMWVEDLIDLIVELSDKECEGLLDCETCMLKLDEPCDYKALQNRYGNLEAKIGVCRGDWDCKNCEEFQSEGAECQYNLLKEKYEKLSEDINESILKMKARNGHKTNSTYNRYTAAKENISPIRLLEIEMDTVIENKIEKMKKKLQNSVIIGGIEVPK